MFDKTKFDDAMERSGLKKRFVAKQLGMGYDTFVKKTHGLLSWKTEEAAAVSKVLKISKSERDAIFFS